MDKINKTNTLREILDKQRYGVDYYQREYRWGEKQVEQMLEDFRSAFYEYYDPSHSVGEVEQYGFYYMGCIVCAKNKEEEKQIIDGQQRLTTLTLLLIYLQKLQSEQGLDGPDISTMIFSDHFGSHDFNLDVPERKACLDALLEEATYEPEDESSRNMLARYYDIVDLFPDELKGDALQSFIYWLADKVLLLEIETPSTDEAHTIFLTMNDRGLSLNSAEMMKAYILQQINERDREEANSRWQNCMNKIKAAAPENSNQPDVEFLSTWLRAKYAETIRAGGRDIKDMDYELLGERFHTWVRQNASTKMGLVKQEDFRDFVFEDLPKACSLYLKLNEYAMTLTEGFETIYYNAHRSLTYQPMLIMAAVRTEDDEEEISAKIKTVSAFIDILASTRTFNFKKVNWNSNRTFLFNTMCSIRDNEVKTIATILIRALHNARERMSAAKDWRLNQANRSAVLQIIARVTSYLNVQMQKPSDFEVYIDRTSGQTYDIEHILPDDYPTYEDSFIDREDFLLWRSHIGNLLILTKDRNRSFQDMAYKEKVKGYAGENIYARSLNAGCYKNNPAFMPLVRRYGFEPYETFGKEEIRERDELFARIAVDIWDPQRVADAAGGVDDEEVLKLQFEDNQRIISFEYAERSWPDAKNFGFLSAETDRLSKIPVGAYVICHIAGRGFCGVGRCCSEAVCAEDFKTEDGKFLMEQEWTDKEAKSRIDPQKEYVIGIDWLKTVGDKEQGYWEKGLYAGAQVVYELDESNDTNQKVLEYFGIELDAPEEE